MRKTVLGIFFFGFVFIFFKIEFGGIDLLIDAVGFLLLFNATFALRRIEGKKTGGRAFGYALPFSIALIAVSAILLFASGPLLIPLTLAYEILYMLFFVFLNVGFLVFLKSRSLHRLSLLTSIGLLLCALMALLQIPALFVQGNAFAFLLGQVILACSWVVHIYTLVIMVVLWVKIPDAPDKRDGG